ncbi:hypothetical protein [Variovorax sp. GB1P17]|uniref:hypothetical protein n=1 Tax=Variovorax sp. GB1P17 TaxID=3443740 RepID=UPI003F48488C
MDVQEIEFVSSYNKVTGLAFTSKTIDDLLDVKSNSDLRGYCRSFLSVARTIDGSSQGVTEVEVARLMRDAIETEAISKMTSGFLNWLGSIFRPLHDPFISGGIALGGAAVSHLGNQASWFQFEGAIDRALRKRDVIHRIDAYLKDK